MYENIFNFRKEKLLNPSQLQAKNHIVWLSHLVENLDIPFFRVEIKQSWKLATKDTMTDWKEMDLVDSYQWM